MFIFEKTNPNRGVLVAGFNDQLLTSKQRKVCNDLLKTVPNTLEFQLAVVDYYNFITKKNVCLDDLGIQ